jgi:hypothetical protein
LSQPTLWMASRVRAAFGKTILFLGSRGLYSITNLMSEVGATQFAQPANALRHPPVDGLHPPRATRCARMTWNSNTKTLESAWIYTDCSMAWSLAPISQTESTIHLSTPFWSNLVERTM